MCSFMDPRVKVTPYLSAAEKASLHDRVIRTLHNTNSNRAQGSVGNSSDISKPSPVKSGALASLLGDEYSTTAVTVEDEELYMFEVRNYLKESSCSMTDSPLEW